VGIPHLQPGLHCHGHLAAGQVKHWLADEYCQDGAGRRDGRWLGGAGKKAGMICMSDRYRQNGSHGMKEIKVRTQNDAEHY
jgi:hypothetical protein